jgi:hypothetical protein
MAKWLWQSAESAVWSEMKQAVGLEGRVVEEGIDLEEPSS